VIAERTGLGRQAACEGEEDSGLARNEMPSTECDEAEKERQADSVDKEKVVAWWCRLGFEMGTSWIVVVPSPLCSLKICAEGGV
jgi:hypothetical protein